MEGRVEREGGGGEGEGGEEGGEGGWRGRVEGSKGEDEGRRITVEEGKGEVEVRIGWRGRWRREE